jgi:hypothetical protein
VELAGVRPGPHDFLLTPAAARFTRQGEIPWVRVVRGVRIEPPSREAKAADLRPELPGPGADVSGVFLPALLPSDQPGVLDLLVLGPRGWAAVPADFATAAARSPVEAGRFPAGLALARPGRFKLAGLAAGEYRLYGRLRAWDPAGPQVQGEELIYRLIPADRPLRTITVEKGKDLDLGEVRLAIPPGLSVQLAALAAQVRQERLIWLSRRFGSPPDEIKDEDLPPR